MPSASDRADMAAWLASQGITYRSPAFLDAMINLLRSMTQ